jgi:two-component system NtrC family sensor kinase
VLSRLSYRVKTPLALSLVIVATTLAVSGFLAWQGWHAAEAGFIEQARGLGKVLARTVRPALLHDDTWQAYETLITPLDRPGGDDRLLVLADARGQIFAASEPRRFPVQDSLVRRLDEPVLSEALAGREAREVAGRNGRYLYLITPILADDGTVLGRLVQRYDRALLGPRLSEVVQNVLLSGFAALFLLLPLGWLAGKRLAEPLSHLADCLGRVGKELPGAIECDLPTGDDEVSRLAHRFKDMVMELKNKEDLEKHLAQSDRLAALGRLSAGIAHEINNPLGGMLNAISNWRRRGGGDPQAEKTLALIERGIGQIRDTVSALLVEARLESRALAPQDLEDLRTLVAADIQRKHLRLAWTNGLVNPVPLPSAQVRQALLNLLLNAVEAAPEGSEVTCRVELADGELTLDVGNAGPAIPPRRREHLFEPYFGEGEGHGLGLWVTYQIVRQMKGRIDVSSIPGYTRFTLALPLEPEDDD